MFSAQVQSRRSQAGRLVHRGFTLIELLLVMVIISILAAIVVPRFAGQGEKARIKAAIADMSNIKTQLQTFEIDNGRFPTTDEGIQALVTNPANLPNWSKGLDKVPLDPWAHPYHYSSPGANGDDFELYSTGPSGQDGNADNIHSN
jgi:general secretion pathway protein G